METFTLAIAEADGKVTEVTLGVDELPTLIAQLIALNAKLKKEAEYGKDGSGA